MNSPNKPPIGLRPEWIHEEQANAKRIIEITEAMGRYIDACWPIPQYFVDELNTRMLNVGHKMKKSEL